MALRCAPLSKIAGSFAFFLWALLLFCARLEARSLNDPLLPSYDYIIIGGGAAGLTVAYRLSANPGVNVLVLEAGQADPGTQEFVVPVFVGADIATSYNWGMVTVPQNYLDGGIRAFPQGRALGGGTILNALLWNRGGQGDFNDWEALGNEGWSWDDMLPYFVRSETFTPVQSPEIMAQFGIGFEPTVHGHRGPVSVTFPNYIYNQSAVFFDALNSLGVPTVADPNEGSQAGAYFLPQDITVRNQTRSDARRSYYDPISRRFNLWISTGQLVTRILFDESDCAETSAGSPSGRRTTKGRVRHGSKSRRQSMTPSLRAIGVEFAANGSTPPTTIYATREVILAAGAIHTPQILELSGIGDPTVLQQFNITPINDLPGVGNNFQDHMLTGTYAYFYNDSYVYPNQLTINATYNQMAMDDYYNSRQGPWTCGPADGDAFPSLPQISSNVAEIANTAQVQHPETYLVPNLDASIIAGYRAQKQLLVPALEDPNRAVIEMLNNNQGGIQIANMRPFSRGTVHIQSPDPFVQPAIDPRYGSNPVDIAVQVEALRFVDAVMNTEIIQSIFHPWQLGPQHGSNESVLIDYVNRNSGTEFHPSGTAAMLPLEFGGVVDPNLLVYGTSNLRVVDASMNPIIPAAHMQAPVYGVAERAADIIIQASTPPRTLINSNCTATAISLSSSSTPYPIGSASAFGGPSILSGNAWNSSTPRVFHSFTTISKPLFRSTASTTPFATMPTQTPTEIASSATAQQSPQTPTVTDLATMTSLITPPSAIIAIEVPAATNTNIPPYPGSYPDTHALDHPFDKAPWAHPWAYVSPPNATQHEPKDQDKCVMPVAPWGRPWNTSKHS